MPVSDDDLRIRLHHAASYAEAAPWDLQAVHVMREPARGAARRPRQRPVRARVASIAAVVFAVAVIGAGLFVGLSRGGSSPSAGGGREVVYRPVAKVSAAILRQDARIMQQRAAALGVVGATATASGGAIDLQVPTGTGEATLAVISSGARLYFRPVLCGAPDFRVTASVPPAARAAHLPSACPADNRYTAADYVAGSDSFDPPAPWGALAGYPTTVASAERAGDPVLLGGPGAESFAPRLLLGPAIASGSILQSASAVRSVEGQWLVEGVLTTEGRVVFDAAAVRYHHTLVGVEIGGVLESAPVMLGTSFHDVAIAAASPASWTEQQAKDLAVVVGDGPLPVALQMAGMPAA